ncbi:MAG: GNAT family N-acetyltransferase [Tannerellaceae bacterium]
MTNKDKYRLLCNTEPSIPLFSRDWWLDAACGETNWEVLLLEQKGRVQAALPLYIPHKGIVSMPPYTQTMGPWFAEGADDTKYTTLLSQRQALSKTLIEGLSIYPHFLQNFSPQITDWLPFYWAGYRQTTRYTYQLRDLSDPSRLWDGMSQHTRRNIIKAREKHQITVKKGISITDFLQIQNKTFERQGISSPQSTTTLERLIAVSRSRGQGDLWGGYDAEGRLHAAAFIIWQKNSAYYLAGGGDPALRDSGAHSLVLWETIQQTATQSCLFDFEGSMLPGVERFFREFGAQQTPYFTISRGKLSLLYRAWLKLTNSK